MVGARSRARASKINWVVQRAEVVKLPPSSRDDAGSVYERRHTEARPKYYRAYVCPNQYEVDVFANCVDNFVSGLNARVYVPIPGTATKAAYRHLEDTFRSWSETLRFRPLSREGLLQRWRVFSSAKRERYIRALDETPTGKISAFVKWEFVKSKGKPRPRIIQFRDAAFLAQIDHWYTPLEYSCSHTPFLFHPADRYMLAKGYNPEQRMAHILEKVESLDDPWVILGDGSAFDAHQRVPSLRAEWAFYKNACKANGLDVRRFNWYRDRQCENIGFARLPDGVVRYKVSGNRCSGDRNTGMGNCLLTAGYIAYAMRELPLSGWRAYIDGDDFILLVSGVHVQKASSDLVQGFKEFDQELDVGGVYPLSTGLEVIEFCQSRPVYVNSTWRLVRNPDKVINSYTRSARWFRDGKSARRYFATISEPELRNNAGVPVLDTFFRQILFDERRLPSESRRWWLRNAAAYTSSGVDECSRLSFERAFGIQPADQVALEHWFGNWVPDFSYHGYTDHEYR